MRLRVGWPALLFLLGLLSFVSAWGAASFYRASLSRSELLFNVAFLTTFYFITWISALVLVMLLHELGHFIVGKFSGFEAFEIKAAFLKWTKLNGRWKLSYDRDLRVGGYVVAFPHNTEKLRQRYQRFLFGGPAASMLAALLSYVALLASATTQNYYLAFFCSIHAYIFVLMAFVSLLPIKSAGLGSDAWWLLKLRKDSPEVDGLLAQLVLGTHVRNGTPLRNLPSDLLTKLSLISSPTVNVLQARILQIYIHLDNDNLEAAREAASDLFLLVRDTKLPDLFVIRAHLALGMLALHDHANVSSAQKHLQHVPREPLWEPARLQMESIIACLEGDDPRAKALARMAVQAVTESPFHSPKTWPAFARGFRTCFEDDLADFVAEELEVKHDAKTEPAGL